MPFILFLQAYVCVLTLTAAHPILHVTDDSSFRLRCSKGTKSSSDTEFPEKKKENLNEFELVADSLDLHRLI